MLFINGKWIPGEGEQFNSINPATGEVLWTGREATREEVDAAVESARAALPEWSHVSAEQREAFLNAFAQLRAILPPPPA